MRAAILLILKFRLLKDLFVSTALRLLIFSLRTLICHIFLHHLHSVAHHRLLLVIVLRIIIKFLAVLVWVHHMLRLDNHSAMKTVHLIVSRCILDHFKFLIVLIIDILIHLFKLNSIHLPLFLPLLVLLFCFFKLVVSLFWVSIFTFLLHVLLAAVFSHIYLSHVHIRIS